MCLYWNSFKTDDVRSLQPLIRQGLYCHIICGATRLEMADRGMEPDTAPEAPPASQDPSVKNLAIDF